MTANLNRAGSNTGISCCWQRQRQKKKTTTKEEPLSYDKPNTQRSLEIHSCVCVRYCKEIKLQKKKRVENNKNGNGVTRNEPDYRPKPPSSFLLPLLYNKQLFRCNCVEFTFYPSCTVVCFPLSHSPLGRLSVCVSVCGHEQVMEGGRGGEGEVCGSLKNNISLYISKSVRHELNQVSVRSEAR